MADPGPKKVGGFLIERELSQGGMGVVLLGHQISLDRPAVLKKLRGELAGSAEIDERFEREARTAAALHHPNVVAVYDRFSWRNATYIAQEYVDGLDLREAIARAGRIPPRIAALITLQVLHGLEAIHGQGTVHRDLKPANILLGREGEVKIADFGIALEMTGQALTRPGMAIGTPAYMPPEQMRGERVGPRGDLFSLAVVLYEMLAGVPPYRESADPETEALLALMERESYASLSKQVPNAPRYLTRQTETALRARARQRLESANVWRRLLERRLGAAAPVEVAREIADWLRESGVIEPREHETERRERPATRRAPRLSRAAVVAAAACLASGVLFVAVDQRESAPKRPVAEPASEEPLDMSTGKPESDED